MSPQCLGRPRWRRDGLQPSPAGLGGGAWSGGWRLNPGAGLKPPGDSRSELHSPWVSRCGVGQAEHYYVELGSARLAGDSPGLASLQDSHPADGAGAGGARAARVEWNLPSTATSTNLRLAQFLGARCLLGGRHFERGARVCPDHRTSGPAAPFERPLDRRLSRSTVPRPASLVRLKAAAGWSGKTGGFRCWGDALAR